MNDNRCAELARIIDDYPPFSGQEIKLAIDRLQGIENCIFDGLRESASSEDWARFGRYVFAASRHPSSDYTAILCGILRLQKDEVNNEDVVEALEVIRDPSSIDCLAYTLYWDPDWDEYRHLAMKCVWALEAVGTDPAIEILRLAAEEPRLPGNVREAAVRALVQSGK